MPRTRAWADFQTGRREVSELFDQARYLEAVPTLEQRMSSQENLHRAALVLLVGHVQAYLQHLMEEFTDTLPTDWSALTELQSIYVSRQVHRRFVRLTNDHQDAELVDGNIRQKFIRNVTTTAGWIANPSQLVLSGEIETLEGFFGEFGTTAIVRHLRLLRGDNTSFVQWLESRDPAYSTFGARFSNLIAIRNDAAHGDAMKRRLTQREAREFRVLAVRIVDLIDLFVQGG